MGIYRKYLKVNTSRLNNFSGSPIKTQHLKTALANISFSSFAADASTLTCYCCKELLTDEPCWPQPQNSETQNRTAPEVDTKKRNKISDWGVVNLTFSTVTKHLPTEKYWYLTDMIIVFPRLTCKKEMNLPICICDSPSTTLVSDAGIQQEPLVNHTHCNTYCIA